MIAVKNSVCKVTSGVAYLQYSEPCDACKVTAGDAYLQYSEPQVLHTYSIVNHVMLVQVSYDFFKIVRLLIVIHS